MNKVVVALVAVIVLAGAAFALTNSASTDKTNNNSSQAQNSDSNNSTGSQNEQAAATITYDGNSFSPASITVKSGDKVIVKNTSSNADLQFDSDPHPAHTDDKDLNVGIVAPGESMSFTAVNKGTFGYHNHLDPTQRGTVIVK